MWECSENRRKLDRLDGSKHVCGRRQRIAVQQVLPNRPLKEYRVLRDKSLLIPVRRLRSCLPPQSILHT